VNAEAHTDLWLNESPTRGRELCRMIANGGDLTEICKDLKLVYGDVILWFHADPGRRQMYEASLTAQEGWVMRTLLAEMKKLATVDIRRAYDNDGNLLPIKDIPADVAACIASVETDEIWSGRGENRAQVGVTKKVKIIDKAKAWELLGKNLRMFVDLKEVKGNLTLAELVEGSMGDSDGGG
jgi:hypothetical protein